MPAYAPAYAAVGMPAAAAALPQYPPHPVGTEHILANLAVSQAQLKLDEAQAERAHDPTRQQALREGEFNRMEDHDLILQDPRHLACCPVTWSRFVNAPFGGLVGAHQRSLALRAAIDAKVLPSAAPAEFKGQRKILQELVKARLAPADAMTRARLVDAVVDRRIVGYMIACQASPASARTFLNAEAHSGLDSRVAHFVSAEAKKPKNRDGGGNKPSDKGKGRGKGKKDRGFPDRKRRGGRSGGDHGGGGGGGRHKGDNPKGGKGQSGKKDKKRGKGGGKPHGGGKPEKPTA